MLLFTPSSLSVFGPCDHVVFILNNCHQRKPSSSTLKIHTQPWTKYLSTTSTPLPLSLYLHEFSVTYYAACFLGLFFFSPEIFALATVFTQDLSISWSVDAQSWTMFVHSRPFLWLYSVFRAVGACLSKAVGKQGSSDPGTDIGGG